MIIDPSFIFLVCTFMVAETSKLAPSAQCGEFISEHSTTWPFTATAGSSGNASSKMERCLERFRITRLLFSTTRQSSSGESRTTRSAKKPMNLIPRSRAGTSLNSLETFPNQETIIRFRRLIATALSYLEDSSRAQELMRPIYALRMEARWSGSALQRIARVFRHQELLRARHITKASCTFLVEWMMIIRSFVIFGSSICKLRHGKRSSCQKEPHSQVQEAVIAQAFSKIRCISLVEFLK